MLAIVQLDSPSVAVLERMLQEDRLPTLAALRKRGRSLPLTTTTTLFEAATYPTLYSGIDVGDHGLYSGLPWSASEQRVRLMDALPMPETVWERLARAGRRSLVIDPYQSRRPRGGAGLWVSGWQFRNRMVLSRWSSPPDVHRSLERELGRPPVAETIFGRQTERQLTALRRALVAAPARAAALACRVLGREPFDLVWITFSGVHLAGHYLWDLSLLRDGERHAAMRDGLEHALADVYAAADEAMGAIVAALPDGADLIVLSPDGMGPNTSRSDLLPGMIEAVLGERPRAPGAALWRLRAVVPARWRAAAASLLPDETAGRVAAWLNTYGVDWSRTRAFAVPGDCHGFVRLNLRGREREGIVDPRDADALLAEVAAGLATFRDPDGGLAVAAVDRVPAGLVAGRRGAWLPDLVVRWSERPAACIEGVTSPVFGDVPRDGAGPGLAGNHADGAWAILLPARARERPLGRPPSLIDVAATACALTGTDATGLAGESLLVRD